LYAYGSELKSSLSAVTTRKLRLIYIYILSSLTDLPLAVPKSYCARNIVVFDRSSFSDSVAMLGLYFAFLKIFLYFLGDRL